MEASSLDPKGTLTPPGSSPLRANCGCSAPPSPETPLTPDSAHMVIDPTNHCEGSDEGRYPPAHQGEPLIGAKKRKAAKVHRVESECLPAEGDSDGLRCTVCQAVLASQHDFTRHIRTHNQVIEDNSGSKLYECGLCQKQLSSNSSLDRHMLVHSGERPFRCHICGTHFTTNGNMHRHIRGHYRNSSSGCGSDTGESDAGSDVGSGLKRPLDTDEERTGIKIAKLSDYEEEYSCPVCGVEQKSSYVLEAHIEKVHPEHHPFINRTRHLSDQTTSLSEVTKSHFALFPKLIAETKQESSGSVSPRNCDICELSFSCTESLINHRKEHSAPNFGGQMFKCDICNGSFNTLAEFSTHRSWHLREQIETQKKESFCSLLALHSKGNSNIYSSPLPVSLMNSPHSPLHLSPSESHSLNSLSGAPRLALSSQSSSSSMSHDEQFAHDYRTMKLNGQYPCRLCKEVFANLRKLKSHNLVHMIAPPYQCNLCSFVSNDKNTLKEHMKNHKGDTPYECNLCSLSFTTKANCERHIKNIHGRQSRDEVKRCMSYNPQEEGHATVEKSPETICNICSIDCKSRSVLRDHMRSSHPEGMDKPFSCKVCQGSFNSDNDAYRHIVQVHAESIQRGNMKDLVECTPKRAEDIPDLSSVEAILRVSKFPKLPLSLTAVKSQNSEEPQGITIPSLTRSESVLSSFPLVAGLSSPATIHACTPPLSSAEDAPLDLSMKKPETMSETSCTDELKVIDETHDSMPQDLSQKIRKEPTPSENSSIKEDSNPESPLKEVKTSFPLVYPGQPPFQFYPFQQQYPFLVNPFRVLPPVSTGLDHVQLLEQYQEIKRGLLPSGGNLFSSANGGFLASNASSLQLSALALATQKEQQHKQQISLSNSLQFENKTPEKKQSSSSEASCPIPKKNEDAPQYPIKNTVLVKKPKQRRYRTERPWRCDLCDKGFTLRSNMERHMKQQHPDLWQHKPRGSSTPKLSTTTSKDQPSHDDPIILDEHERSTDEFKESLNEGDLSKEEEETELIIDDEEEEDDVEEEEEEVEEMSDEEEKEEVTDKKEKEEASADLASVHTILSAASTHSFPFFPREGEDSSCHQDDGCEDRSTTQSPTLKDSKEDVKKSAYSSAPQKQKCPFCNRKFPWSSSLVRHIRTHTGQKPYLCPVCRFPFTTKSNCDRHLQRKHPDSPHTLLSDRPHKCAKCPGAAFTSTESLRKHEMFKHDRQSASFVEVAPKHNDNVESFRCHVCDASFYSSKTTLRHISEVHPQVFRTLRESPSRMATKTEEDTQTKAQRSPESSDPNEMIRCMLCFSTHQSSSEFQEHVNTLHVKAWEEVQRDESQRVRTDSDDDEEEEGDEGEEDDDEGEEEGGGEKIPLVSEDKPEDSSKENLQKKDDESTELNESVDHS